MSSLGIHTWNGISGKTYKYFIYRYPPALNSHEVGNYIYTRLLNDEWVPLLIGEGPLSETRCERHPKGKCLAKKMVTHVHAHIGIKADLRIAEQKDLLASYPIAYEPSGCNEHNRE